MGRAPAPGAPPDLSDNASGFRPTSEVVPVGTLANFGDYFVYWSNRRLCLANRDVDGFANSEACVPMGTAAGQAALDPVPDGAHVALAVVRGDVASVTLAVPGAAALRARIVGGRGFPARVAVIVGRDVRGGRWYAYDAAGRSLPTAQPFELDIRQVYEQWAQRDGTCSGHRPMDGEVVRGADHLTCYTLSWEEIRVRRAVSATAQQVSPAGSWSVLAELTPADAQQFANLTRRVAGGHEPLDRLAFVLDDNVLMAPSIQSRIADGTIQLATPSMTERQARELAAELSSG